MVSQLLCERVVKRERLKVEHTSIVTQMAKGRLLDGDYKPGGWVLWCRGGFGSSTRSLTKVVGARQVLVHHKRVSVNRLTQFWIQCGVFDCSSPAGAQGSPGDMSVGSGMASGSGRGKGVTELDGEVSTGVGGRKHKRSESRDAAERAGKLARVRSRLCFLF